MWRSHSKSDLLVHNSSSSVSFSSFKDTRNIHSTDDNSQPQDNPNLNPNPNPNQHTNRRPSSSLNPNPNPSPSSNSSILQQSTVASAVIRSFEARSPEPDPVPVTERKSLPEPELPLNSNASLTSNVDPVNELLPSSEPVRKPKISIPGAEKRIVVYLTSLRVVRSTFEDCRAVQSILQGFRVNIDKRDLSMDCSFLSELQRILGYYETKKLTLPRVFIGGRYIGGADEVITLHETGELKKIVKGLPAAAAGVCEVCGGYRFILCDKCDGSHKCYTEENDGSDGGFIICTLCNENGLLRCPTCNCEPLVPV